MNIQYYWLKSAEQNRFEGIFGLLSERRNEVLEKYSSYILKLTVEVKWKSPDKTCYVLDRNVFPMTVVHI